MVNKFKKPLLIYNPLAAGGKTKNFFNEYFKKLNENNFFKKIDIFETFSKDDTINKIKKIDKNKNDLIITLGGDGSISTVTNGLMNLPKNKRIPLFPLPCGSGNSLLRDFNILTIEDAINKYKTETPKDFDVIYYEEINGKLKGYCINVLGMGFVSNIAEYVVGKGKKYGAFSYVLGTLLTLTKFEPYKTTIKYGTDKKIFKSDKIFFMTLSNTKYSGGKIMVAPEAKYNDGLLDVVILHDLGRIRFLKGFVNTFKGTHIKDKKCMYFKIDKIEIYSEPKFTLMPDGELGGNSPIRVKVIPKQVKLIV